MILYLFLQLLLILVPVTGFAIFEGLADAYAIKEGTYSRRQKLSHLYNWLSRSLCAGLPILLFFGFTLKAMAMVAFAAVLFWLVFEYTINWKLNRPFDAVGRTAWTDKQIRALAIFLSRHPRVYITPETVKKALHLAAVVVVVALLSLTACQRPPQTVSHLTTVQLATVPEELKDAPPGSTYSTPESFYLKLNDSTAAKTSGGVVIGKIKIKNSGNTYVDNSLKKSGNTDSFNPSKKSGNTDSFNPSKNSGNADSYNDNKKQGQQQDVGNQKIKDVGNTETKSYWWVWLIILFLIVLASVFWIYWRKLKTLPLPF